MSDVIDQACERETLDRELAIRACDKPMLASTGYCYNCAAVVGLGYRFCDADCRDDYERAQRARLRKGNVDGL